MPKRAAKFPNLIHLAQVEQVELRCLELQKTLAEANAQAATAILTNRAQLIAGAHGIDLSDGAKGNWLLTISEGTIKRKVD